MASLGDAWCISICHRTLHALAQQQSCIEATHCYKHLFLLLFVPAEPGFTCVSIRSVLFCSLEPTCLVGLMAGPHCALKRVQKSPNTSLARDIKYSGCKTQIERHCLSSADTTAFYSRPFTLPSSAVCRQALWSISQHDSSICRACAVNMQSTGSCCCAQ